MCCYEGTYLEKTEALELLRIVDAHSGRIQSIGVELPPNVVISETDDAGNSTPRIALKPRAFSSMVAHYPGHFADTGCTFLLDDGRCGLQTLGMISDSTHKWHYKPLGCWYYPIYLDEETDPITLKICAPGEDPYHKPGYPGFITYTDCGKDDCGGEPAYQVLSEELDFLGEIAGRNLRAEIELCISNSAPS
jgi:hypothetical protein